MHLTESRIRRLIIMSIRERELLHDWFAMAPHNERDEDFLVILESLNDRARKLGAERKAEAEARHEEKPLREHDRSRERMLGTLS